MNLTDAERFCAQCLDDIESLLTATAYCKQCREYICSDMCLRQHAKYRLSKSHGFILDEELKQFLHTNGVCVDDNSSESAIINTGNEDEVHVLVERQQAVLRTEFNIRTAADKEICSINASVVLENGDIVVADLKNSSLKLFNPESRICTATLKLEKGPKAICLSNWSEKELYVVENGVKGVHVVNAKDLSILKTLPTEGINFGVTCWKRGIAITTSVYQTYYGHYELRLLDYHGRLQSSFVQGKVKNLEFNLPWFICSNKNGENVIISDYGNNSVTCIDVDGGVLFVYTDKELLIRPVSLATDTHDDIFVVGQRSHNIHHLSSSGEKKGIIYSENAMEFPGGLSFDNKRNRFYVQCTGWSDTIQIFDLVVK